MRQKMTIVEYTDWHLLAILVITWRLKRVKKNRLKQLIKGSKEHKEG
jgi:hypothetical protein